MRQSPNIRSSGPRLATLSPQRTVGSDPEISLQPQNDQKYKVNTKQIIYLPESGLSRISVESSPLLTPSQPPVTSSTWVTSSDHYYYKHEQIIIICHQIIIRCHQTISSPCVPGQCRPHIRGSPGPGSDWADPPASLSLHT